MGSVLLRRYGRTLQSVVPDFDPWALTEVAFRRDRVTSIPAPEFEESYEKVREAGLDSAADGPVQADAERRLLEGLRAKLDELTESLGEDEVLVVESESGVDWPKTRERRKDVIVEGENRLHFHWTVEPPLRVGVYRRRP